jgi:acetyl esterase/lipase
MFKQAGISMARRSGVFGALAALLSGCSALGALDVVVARGTYRGEDDIGYGLDPRQRLDVYRPLTGAAGAPLVVFFYGGSWSQGSRSDYRFVGEALASNGVVAVVADYRLSPQVGWRDILSDCAQATRWAFDNAQRLGADPRRVFLMGHSAGAYNAAMLALDAQWLRAQALRPAQLAGWIGLAGPYDFLPIGDRSTQVAFDWPRTPRESQPIEHVSARSPRTLLVAATGDTVVSTQRSTVGLSERLRAAQVPVEVRLFDKLNHATVVGALAGPLTRLAPVRQEVLAFVTNSPSAPST